MNCPKVCETKTVNQNNSLQAWKQVTKTEQEGNVAVGAVTTHTDGASFKGQKAVN